MPTIAHYEVYTLEDSGWVLHARYVSADKGRAIDEARSLDVQLGRPTKVMRESYDTETSRYAEQTVFLSPKALEARKMGRFRPSSDAHQRRSTIMDGLRPNAMIPPGLDSFGADTVGDGVSKRFGAPTHAKSTSDLLGRVMIVIVASLIISTAGTALIPIVMNMLSSFGVIVSGAALSKTLFAVFMVLFLTSGFFLTLRLVPLQGVKTSPRTERRDRSRPSHRQQRPASQDTTPAPPSPDSPEPAPVSSPTPTPTEATSPDTATPDSPDSAGHEKQGATTAHEKQKPKHQQKQGERKDSTRETADEQERREKTRQKEQAKRRKKRRETDADTPDTEPLEDDADFPKEDDEDDANISPPEEKLSPAFEQGHDTVMSFLGGYVTALKTIRPRLDTYNRFGINLYLAGVCEVVAGAAGMTRIEFLRLLQETVEIMGTRPVQAESFVRQLDDYLREDRYGQMVQHGREAMALGQSETGEPFANLGMVIEDWNMPKTQKVTGSTIAIVFTDIVGSTDLTSEHGDIKAQQILRAHNSAVRSALARYSGREIKHTGDGIMATFEHVPDAVWGMIDVLKAVRAHNQVQPEIPLKIRIGINAGEPISAENDYYGLSVTIAARICAKADMDQIFVSQIVRDMCEGTELRFADRGAEPLKGIKEPQKLHEALWDEAATDADANAIVVETEDKTAADASNARTKPDATRSSGPDKKTDNKTPGGSDKTEPAPFDPEADGWLDPQANQGRTMDAPGRAI